MPFNIYSYFIYYSCIILKISGLALVYFLSFNLRVFERLRFLISFSFLLVAFISCSEKEKPKVESFEASPGNMVLVCNEGNFRWGNASVGVLNLTKQTWIEDAFKAVNNRALGDVLQSATLWNNLWFLVVNNSSKIEVVEPEKFTSVKTISGLGSPRFLLPISDSKAYISDIYAGQIWILNQNSTSPAGSIRFYGWSEEMVLSNKLAWISCRNKPKVFVVNAESDNLIDSVSIPGNCTSIAMAGNGKIWVGFEASATEKAGVALIDPSSRLVERLFYSNQSNFYPSHFQPSATKDSLFFMQNGAFMISQSDVAYPTNNFAQGLTGNWYGLGFDSKRGEIYLSDAKDFSQKSRIFRINIKTGIRTELPGGIITSRFYFW